MFSENLNCAAIHQLSRQAEYLEEKMMRTLWLLIVLFVSMNVRAEIALEDSNNCRGLEVTVPEIKRTVVLGENWRVPVMAKPTGTLTQWEKDFLRRMVEGTNSTNENEALIAKSQLMRFLESSASTLLFVELEALAGDKPNAHLAALLDGMQETRVAIERDPELAEAAWVNDTYPAASSELEQLIGSDWNAVTKVMAPIVNPFAELPSSRWLKLGESLSLNSRPLTQIPPGTYRIRWTRSTYRQSWNEEEKEDELVTKQVPATPWQQFELVQNPDSKYEVIRNILPADWVLGMEVNEFVDAPSGWWSDSNLDIERVLSVPLRDERRQGPRRVLLYNIKTGLLEGGTLVSELCIILMPPSYDGARNPNMTHAAEFLGTTEQGHWFAQREKGWELPRDLDHQALFQQLKAGLQPLAAPRMTSAKPYAKKLREKLAARAKPSELYRWIVQASELQSTNVTRLLNNPIIAEALQADVEHIMPEIKATFDDLANHVLTTHYNQHAPKFYLDWINEHGSSEQLLNSIRFGIYSVVEKPETEKIIKELSDKLVDVFIHDDVDFRDIIGALDGFEKRSIFLVPAFGEFLTKGGKIENTMAGFPLSWALKTIPAWTGNRSYENPPFENWWEEVGSKQNWERHPRHDEIVARLLVRAH
jgi:hypothetical protein